MREICLWLCACSQKEVRGKTLDKIYFFFRILSKTFSIISVLLFLSNLRMFGGLMTKQQHNINCINRILGLNIPQITQAVRNAIRKHNIFDGDRPTNADLLKIVFECLTVYLENLNLQHISANVRRLVK